MKLRNRLALSYTAVFVLLLGITFTAIYYIAKKNRVTEFHQRFKERTLIPFRLLAELHNLDSSVLKKLDKSTINDLRKNTVLFDADGNLIYSSTANGSPAYTVEILARLRGGRGELFMKTGEGELFGSKFTVNDKTYFGVAVAEDRFGKQRMRFLALLLLTSFLISVGLLVALSFYLSASITAPITKLAAEIEDIEPGKLSIRVAHKEGKSEVAILTSKFNEMLERVERSFKFQHQFISHLSHELRATLALMMSNAEAALIDNDVTDLRKGLVFQKGGVAELSNILNTMLELSKRENEKGVYNDVVRIDELLFECFAEVELLNSKAKFDFRIEQFIEQSEYMAIKGNSKMLKLAFFNLLRNAINYSTNQVAKIVLITDTKYLQVSVINDGLTLTENEAGQLFNRLFRGTSSRNTSGFGLGLGLTSRIAAIHNAMLTYTVTDEGENSFSLRFSLI